MILYIVKNIITHQEYQSDLGYDHDILQSTAEHNYYKKMNHTHIINIHTHMTIFTLNYLLGQQRRLLIV